MPNSSPRTALQAPGRAARLHRGIANQPPVGPRPITAGPGVVVGLDLAGSERRDSGYCVLTETLGATARVLHTDSEILEAIALARPTVVSIDAPLFLPLGRTSIESRGPPHLRACDRILLRMGIRFFPVSLGPMRMLTRRGMAIAIELRARGLAVIEGYPGAGQDILGIPRKGASLRGLRRGLRALGLRGDIDRPGIGHDELDAITCAWIGLCFRTGDFLAIGEPSEGWMVLPNRLRSLGRLRQPPGTGRRWTGRPRAP
ncbi:MAG TPA: DUF429 domain-containing protein [Thermoplasmata archaeon]|nr:DUF429 domain-containing protein [Thermoplasmata archaeon]